MEFWLKLFLVFIVALGFWLFYDNMIEREKGPDGFAPEENPYSIRSEKLGDGEKQTIEKDRFTGGVWNESEKEEKETHDINGVLPKEQKKEYVSLLDSIVDAKAISKGCFEVVYPSFKVYVFWEPCEVNGKYSLSSGGTTFVFDEESVKHLIEKEGRKNIEKLKSRLENMSYRIVLFVSEDGLNWKETEIIVAEHADVPDLLVDKEGKLRVYFVSYPWNKIKVAISEDGKDWDVYDVEGIERGWVDPEVLLIDGTYYLYSPKGNLHTAKSKDGINFEQIHSSELAVMDPTVFEINGIWYMVAGPGLNLYESEDGIHFGKKRKLEFDAEVCDSLRRENEVWLYCHRISKEGSSILLLKTKDAEKWEIQKILTTNKFLADPTVAFFKGKFYLAATTVSQDVTKRT